MPKLNTNLLEEGDLRKIVAALSKANAFTSRKICDTPTDNLSVVNMKFVTNNGASANRPVSSIIGQTYFDTTLASGRGKPIWWNGSGFVDATGTYV